MNPATPSNVRALGDFISLIQLAASDKGIKKILDDAAVTLEEAQKIREDVSAQIDQNRKDMEALANGFAQLDESKERFLAAKSRTEHSIKEARDQAIEYRDKLDNEIKAKEDNIAAREKVVNDREHFLDGREKEIEERASTLEAKQLELDTREAELIEKMENLRKAVG